MEQNGLRNCLYTRADILEAEDIFGPDPGGLEGKTIGRDPPHVPSKLQGDPLPREVRAHYREVSLCANVMYANGVPCFSQNQ